MENEKWTIQKAEKALARLNEKKAKKEEEIDKKKEELKGIEKEISEMQQIFNDLSKEKTLCNISKVLFTDNNFSQDQINKLLSIIETVGSNIDNIDASTLSELVQPNKAEMKDGEM